MLSDRLAARLDEMSARKLRKILRREGCVELRQKGSHLQVKCGSCRGTIPIHGSRDIKKGTLGAIERSLEVCLGDDWIEAEEGVLGPALDALIEGAREVPLNKIKVLYREPRTMALWGIPYEMRPGQQPRDLANHPRRGWVYLGSPGWRGSMPRGRQEKVKSWIGKLGNIVPSGPNEWSRVADAS